MKKILTLFLATIMMFSVSACGGKSSYDTVQNSKSITKAIAKAKTVEEVDELVLKDVENTVATLSAEFEKLSADVATYEKYKTDGDKVTNYYDMVENNTYLLGVRLREYSAAYADLIISSDKSFDDKDDELEIIYDSVYDDACDEIYDKIYDDIFDDMYDMYYDGILDDAYDNIPYDEWNKAKTDAYDLLLDTRSDVYDIKLDVASDVYGFIYDIKYAMWDKDTEKANEKLQKFKDDIETLYEHTDERKTTKKGATNEDLGEDVLSQETAVQESADEKQWEQFLVAYEEWVDDYIDVLGKYNENPADVSILSDYTEMMTEFAEWQTKADEIEAELEDASADELAEYSSKLLEIATKIAEVTY